MSITQANSSGSDLNYASGRQLFYRLYLFADQEMSNKHRISWNQTAELWNEICKTRVDTETDLETNLRIFRVQYLKELVALAKTQESSGP